jgi:hypothetical protein
LKKILTIFPEPAKLWQLSNARLLSAGLDERICCGSGIPRSDKKLIGFRTLADLPG